MDCCNCCIDAPLIWSSLCVCVRGGRQAGRGERPTASCAGASGSVFLGSHLVDWKLSVSCHNVDESDPGAFSPACPHEFSFSMTLAQCVFP